MESPQDYRAEHHTYSIFVPVSQETLYFLALVVLKQPKPLELLPDGHSHSYDT